mmetsp:Transcript_2438/g.3471  ORF Transcript_2438/g.3471 Transcript_2438/m.3471 type:complete len:100 (+) Transcript_2438:434-733(+)
MAMLVRCPYRVIGEYALLKQGALSTGGTAFETNITHVLIFGYVCDHNNGNDHHLKGLKSYLTKPFLKFQDVAWSVAKACISCKIELDEDEFVDKFNPGM